MNGLCRLSHVKTDESGVGALSNTSDTVLGILRTIDDVSAEFERETSRPMYATQATRYLDGPSPASAKLWLGQDLISLTTLKVDEDGDGVYELTLTVNTDYWLWPDNETPKRRVDLNPLSSNLTTWTAGRRRIEIVGLFGYSNETEAGGTTAEVLDTSETGVDLTAGHTVEPGDTIWIDSEQMYVQSVAVNTATVVRGVNGTTAATHSTSAAVTVRRYPRDVEMAVKERVVGLRWDTQSGYAGQAMLSGDAIGASGGSLVRASYARWRKAVEAYRPVVVA